MCGLSSFDDTKSGAKTIDLKLRVVQRVECSIVKVHRHGICF